MCTNEEFWREAYQRNIQKMTGICYRYIRDEEVSKDLAHDAFLRAMDRAGTFRGEGTFDHWLRKIAVNTALLYLREGVALRFDDWEDTVTTIESFHTDEACLNRVDRFDFSVRELLDMLQCLPEQHRIVFNLYVIDHYSHKQIADELNISVGTSKSHLSRARKKLQRLLSEKAEEKEKKKKALVFFLFPFLFLHRVYASAFDNFTLPSGQDNLFLLSYPPACVKFLPFYLKIAGIITLLVAVFVGGVVWLATEEREKKEAVVEINNQSGFNYLKEDSVKLIQPLSEEKSSEDTTVVIKRKIIKRNAVVVRDTVRIIDDFL